MHDAFETAPFFDDETISLKKGDCQAHRFVTNRLNLCIMTGCENGGFERECQRIRGRKINLLENGAIGIKLC